MLNNIDIRTAETGYIEAVKGLHGALKFTYIPMLNEDREAIRTELGSKSGLAVSRRMQFYLNLRVKTWDNVDDKGNEVPISEESMRTLRPDLFNKLYLIVAGARANDSDPEAVTDPDVDAETQAILEGRNLGAIKEERSTGN